MSYPHFILVLVSCWSVTYLFADAAITEPIRRRVLFRREGDVDIVRNELLGELFSCYFCLGTWVSLALFCIYGPFDRWLPLRVLAGATFAYGFNVILERIENHAGSGNDD